MSREEILLKEYEVCQHDSSSMISAQWTVTGIFMGINTAVLGAITYGILSSAPLHDGVKCLVLGFGIAIIIITIFLKLWLRRVNFLIRINNHRMREIETKLGMSKNWIVNYVDHPNQWEKLTDKEKGRLCELYRKRPCLKGYWCVKGMFCTLIALWVFLIVIAFIN